MPAAEPGAAVAADGVDLVDEDDARGVLLALLEQVAHPAGADADEHLDEVGARDGEEGHVGLAGDRTGQERLTGSRRAHEQHALGDLAAELLELLRLFAGTRRSPDSSSLASSTPATSRNVTFLPWAEVSLARDLPKDSARLPPDCIWRMKKIHTPRNKSIGDQVSSSVRKRSRAASLP